MTTRTNYTLVEVTQALHDAKTDKDIDNLINMTQHLSDDERRTFWLTVLTNYIGPLPERTLQ